MRFRSLVIAMSRTDAHSGKARAQHALQCLDASGPVFQAEDGNARANCFDRNRLMICVCAAAVWGAPHDLAFAAVPATVVALAPRPSSKTRRPSHIASPSSVTAVRNCCAIPITRIGQHHSRRNLLLNRLPDLFQSNLRLGLKLNLFGNPGLPAALRILTPHLRQIQPPRNRQTRTPRAHRQTHRHLAVLLFAHLTAVLPSDSHRMLALLRETRCHPQSTPPPDRASASPATPAAAPQPASPRHSRAPQPPNDAATDACGERCRAPGAPPSARRSCALRATTVPCSSSSTACAGLRAPRRSPGPRYMPRSASPVGLARRGVIPQNNSTSKCFFMTQ